MKTRLWSVMLTAGMLFGLGSALLAPQSGTARAQASEIRWDITHIISFTPVTATEGGIASAKANDNSMITLSGHGTFVAPPSNNAVNAVTGGGTWITFSPIGTPTGSGTYRVIALVSWTPAPGTQTSTVVDEIGNGTLADNSAGLAVLRIEYSDGIRGILFVSCHLNGGPGPAAPPSIFEGITASKGFTDYWNRVAPVANVDGNRTLFHVIR